MSSNVPSLDWGFGSADLDLHLPHHAHRLEESVTTTFFHTTNQVVESSLHFVGMHSWFEFETHTLDPCGHKCECNIIRTEMFTQFGILSIL
jgi:hypothetical protein